MEKERSQIIGMRYSVENLEDLLNESFIKNKLIELDRTENLAEYIERGLHSNFPVNESKIFMESIEKLKSQPENAIKYKGKNPVNFIGLNFNLDPNPDIYGQMYLSWVFDFHAPPSIAQENKKKHIYKYVTIRIPEDYLVGIRGSSEQEPFANMGEVKPFPPYILSKLQKFEFEELKRGFHFGFVPKSLMREILKSADYITVSGCLVNVGTMLIPEAGNRDQTQYFTLKFESDKEKIDQLKTLSEDITISSFQNTALGFMSLPCPPWWPRPTHSTTELERLIKKQNRDRFLSEIPDILSPLVNSIPNGILDLGYRVFVPKEQKMIDLDQSYIEREIAFTSIIPSLPIEPPFPNNTQNLHDQTR